MDTGQQLTLPVSRDQSSLKVRLVDCIESYPRAEAGQDCVTVPEPAHEMQRHWNRLPWYANISRMAAGCHQEALYVILSPRLQTTEEVPVLVERLVSSRLCKTLKQFGCRARACGSYILPKYVSSTSMTNVEDLQFRGQSARYTIHIGQPHKARQQVLFLLPPQR